MQVETWQVYLSRNCRHAEPNPKDKYLVIVGFINGTPLGVFINSKIRPYIQKQPHLMVCETQIAQQDHNFLKYDSYVDCTNAYELSSQDLDKHLGDVDENHRETILKSVKDCASIRNKHKKAILASHSK